MKNNSKNLGQVSLLILLIVAVFSITRGSSMAAEINPGKTSGYAILSGETITNTGHTTISGSAGGDIGIFPGSEFPGSDNVTLIGSIHISDITASEAKDDLVTFYNNIADIFPVTRIASELGETTLTPGTYDSKEGTFLITGTLTLDGQGNPGSIFVFKTESTLIAETNSRVKLINEAQYCKVFWQVGSSATLKTNSNFGGHLVALTSIAAENGAVIQGQLLARNGSVTLDTNTITNVTCGYYPTSEEGTTTTPGEGTTTTLGEGNTNTSKQLGGQLPNTSTPVYVVLIMGTFLTILGVVGISIKKIYE